MRLEFAITIDDHVAMYTEAAADRPPTPPKGTLWFYLLIGLFGAVVAGAYVATEVAGISTRAVVSGALDGFVAGCATQILCLMLYLVWEKVRGGSAKRMENLVRAQFESGAVAAECGPASLEIVEGTLTWTSERFTIVQLLAMLDDVVERPESVTLTRDGHAQYRVPARAFRDEDQRKEFVQLVREHLGVPS